jgi:coniferyl-aldehyde dehydrogenase
MNIGETARELLNAQRAALVGGEPASVQVRTHRLDRALELLVSNQAQICAAVAADFGQRPAALTQLMDIFPAVHALKCARRHVRQWMRPRRRRLALPIGVPGARGEILYQPLGVVGLISPWNFPVTLTFGPLAGVLAAGNRCLMKLSESTPRTAELIQDLIARHFEATEVAAVTGGADVAAAFARLPFDHLVFTGSAVVGRRVMAAAAEHLVPVTLELGGKCPAVIGRSADLARAMDRILIGKLVNAGQMCLAPDYACVPRESLDACVREAQLWSKRVYPGIPENPDYTSLINERHVRHAEELLADALAKGARVISLDGNPITPTGPSRLMTPALITGVTDHMRIMQEEIFAPLLPLLAYDRIGEVIADINRREPPLALYYFGNDRAEERGLLGRTRSGGVTVNDVAMNFLADELPFGGVGASGMGAYHGAHGFERFSHARAIFRQSRFDVGGLLGLRPPYGTRLTRSLRFLIRR